MLLQVYSADFWVLRNPFKGYTRSNYFQNNTKILFAFIHCVGICTDKAKATVGNSAGVLSWIKAMTLIVLEVTVFFTTTYFQ